MTEYEATHQRTGALHYDGKGNTGRRIIIDAAEVRPNFFDVVVLRPDGTEIEYKTATSLEGAKSLYDEFFNRYTKPEYRPPLSGKYAKLRDDLKTALEAGRAAEAADPEDGGTCNLDAAALTLLRWKENLVKQAAEEAGTGCFVWTLFNHKHFVFIPNSRGQANARSRNAEAMVAALTELGYEALDYCEMD